MAALTKAVVLAAGRGTRMRAGSDVALTDAQRAAAERGLKPLIPIHGHPFIAYALSSIADAGFTDVCVVTGPGVDPVRATLAQLATSRVRLHFATQHVPRGSADAVLAAESFAAEDDFMVVNADNDYPAAALAALRRLEGPGLIGFSRHGLVRGGINPSRIASYALLDVADGQLQRIIEKPSIGEAAGVGANAPVSMTCWRFGRFIFDACRRVKPSRRGEHELPDAVGIALRDGVRFDVIAFDGAVADLSRREDISEVERAFSGRHVNP